MFAITADQVDSRNDSNRGEHALALMREIGGEQLILPPDRTSGDEVQALTADAATALELVLALVRTGRWRVGLGIGSVDTPLAESTRTATGPAFVAARAAIDAARKRPQRVAIATETTDPDSPAAPSAVDAPTLQAMLDLLLSLRSRRSPEGWELQDLLDAGRTQTDAAATLGITPQAASKRAIAAGTRIDRAARDGLAALLAAADAAALADSSDTGPHPRDDEGAA